MLFLQGDTLLVYTNPVEGLAFRGAPCCFDGKLLVPLQDEKLETVGGVGPAWCVVAGCRF